MGAMISGKILGLYRQIRDVLTQARARAWQAVNSEMAACYWEIGRLILEEEQRGAARADYGKRLIRDLSKRLSEEFGKGFDKKKVKGVKSRLVINKSSIEAQLHPTNPGWERKCGQ
jgi:hypothetical protein